jgi:hypothetical protein
VLKVLNQGFFADLAAYGMGAGSVLAILGNPIGGTIAIVISVSAIYLMNRGN